MNRYPETISNLIDLFVRLPGLGPKGAERIVFYLLQNDDSFAGQLAQNIAELKKTIKLCSRCFNIDMTDPCHICNNVKRDQSIICVVAEAQDIMVIEKTGDYHGRYHVLGGVLNPVEGITPDKLHLSELFEQIKNSQPVIKEVIIATNPDLEGESTALYLVRKLKELPIKITRLARGLPMGSTIEYADEITIASALKGRQEIS